MKADEIKNKINNLRKADKELKVFGSNVHQYKSNEIINIHDISEYEEKNNVTLPESFVSYLREVGNGGPGPGYGILPLEEVKTAKVSLIKANQISNANVRYLRIANLGHGLYAVLLPDIDDSVYYYDFSETNSINLENNKDFITWFLEWGM